MTFPARQCFICMSPVQGLGSRVLLSSVVTSHAPFPSRDFEPHPLFLFLFVLVSLLQPWCPGTHSVDQANLELENSSYLCLLNAGVKLRCNLSGPPPRALTSLSYEHSSMPSPPKKALDLDLVLGTPKTMEFHMRHIRHKDSKIRGASTRNWILFQVLSIASLTLHNAPMI